jgi:hypothetical protein
MLGAGAGTGLGAGGFFGAAVFGAAAFGATAFGAAAFGAAAFRAAFAFGFAFLTDFLAALFFFATTRFFLRAGAAFTRFFAFLVFDFAFFAFFAMIASRSLRLRIRFANATIRHLANTAASPAALETRLPANDSGAGPPVAQSTSSTV